ncbi:hypothetical protein [Mycoplasma feriruminatoris]|uniref:Uncharacterized protein n=1 Tax=Mycoplasma feriruminatoris TaxID=1179777 RepID=A0AAX3TG56_9MOLU|nr:hypothetical protein [Mycoplasma feriruminatoris]WFQ93034.1 hypothetical protein MFERI14822_00827 [Mycoplasma feriruminatoris]
MVNISKNIKQYLTNELKEKLKKINAIAVTKDNFVVIDCSEHFEISEKGGDFTDSALTKTFNFKTLDKYVNLYNMELDDFDDEDDEVEIHLELEGICSGCFRPIDVRNQETWFTGFKKDNSWTKEELQKQVKLQFVNKLKTGEIKINEWVMD